MKIIQIASFCSADFLATQLQQGHEKRADYYFGFQVIYQSIVKIAFLTSIALILGTLKPILLIVMSFTSIRFFAGGVHMDTYAKCLFITLAAFIPASLLCKYFVFNKYICLIFLLCTLITSIIITFKWAPKESPMNQIERGSSQINLKRFSLISIIFWTVIALLLSLFGQIESSMSICLGILIEMSTIFPSGILLYNKIGKFLNRG